jgi:hypothetical protein
MSSFLHRILEEYGKCAGLYSVQVSALQHWFFALRNLPVNVETSSRREGQHEVTVGKQSS